MKKEIEKMNASEVEAVIEKKLKKLGLCEDSAVPPTEYLTIEEVGRLLRLSRTTIWKYRKDGILKARTIGNKTLFARADIDEILKGGCYE